MKSLKPLFFVILIIITIPSHAQRFQGGLLAGLSTSQINGDTQKGFDKLGFFTGVSVATDFTDVIGAKIELYYIGKGAKQNTGGVEVFKTKLHYIEMPFLFTLRPLKNFEFDLGLTGSYLISSKLYEYEAEVPDGLNDMHNFDFGAIGSATYFFTKSIGLNVRMEHSLMPVKNDPNWYNYNFSFGVAYKILTSK